MHRAAVRAQPPLLFSRSRSSAHKTAQTSAGPALISLVSVQKQQAALSCFAKATGYFLSQHSAECSSSWWPAAQFKCRVEGNTTPPEVPNGWQSDPPSDAGAEAGRDDAMMDEKRWRSYREGQRATQRSIPEHLKMYSPCLLIIQGVFKHVFLDVKMLFVAFLSTIFLQLTSVSQTTGHCVDLCQWWEVVG